MTRLKAFVATLVVVATIGVWSLAAAPSASAATNLTCSQARSVAMTYTLLSAQYYEAGSAFWGGFYAVLAELTFEAYC